MSASDTKNVKIGVCRAYLDGVDLGYTQGGCEVSVTTQTHVVEVDQFGKSPVSEVIMGRMVKVKVPMAETTIDKMALIMPGATVTATGGSVATGTITPTGNPTTGQNLVINGVTVTLKTVPALAYEVALGATLALTLVSLVNYLNASTDPALAAAQYSASATVLTVTSNDQSAAANLFTLALGTVIGSVSGATLTGGVDGTSKRVTVIDGVGINMLNIAKELRLHPQNLAANDLSEDFVIPLAATAGALTFAYKLENERVFNAEFTGFPDPVTRKLYHFGV